MTLGTCFEIVGTGLFTLFVWFGAIALVLGFVFVALVAIRFSIWILDHLFKGIVLGG